MTAGEHFSSRVQILVQDETYSQTHGLHETGTQCVAI